MTGPYTVRFTRNAGRDTIDEVDAYDLRSLPSVERIGERYAAFDQYGHSTGPMLCALRAGAAYAATCIAPGELVHVEVHGTHGGKPCMAHGCTVRRDEHGRLYSTIGSKMGRERYFIGL